MTFADYKTYTNWEYSQSDDSCLIDKLKQDFDRIGGSIVNFDGGNSRQAYFIAVGDEEFEPYELLRSLAKSLPRGKGVESNLETVQTDEETTEFWDEIVRNPDGTLNEKQVYLELSDFLYIMGQVSQVYSDLTCSRLSKPNYEASRVVSEVEQVYEEHYAEHYREKIIEIANQLFDGDEEVLQKMLAIAVKQ